MRMTLCWTDISGYMAACWRALSQVSDVELTVIAFQPAQKSFDPELVRGINVRFITPQEREDVHSVERLVKETRPDVLYVSGWFVPAYRRLIYLRDMDSVSRWIGVDTPWWGTWKQQLGRIVLRGLIRRVDRIFVAGERAWQYMRMLGAPQSKVRRGLYGVDYDTFAPLHEQRVQQAPDGWPRRFLFIGRYVQEKGIDVLVEAYAKYRSSVPDPWTLGACGGGNLEHLLNGKSGIENFGFQQPAALLEIMRRHGVFVLPSHFDPWPLVVVESSAAGLPVICTEACGSAVELVRPFYNGITIPTGDADALVRSMRWTHENHADLPEMGARGRQLAAAYSAQVWATRWAQAARECLAVKKG